MKQIANSHTLETQWPDRRFLLITTYCSLWKALNDTLGTIYATTTAVYRLMSSRLLVCVFTAVNKISPFVFGFFLLKINA